MKPNDENNFLIEVTPEVINMLNKTYMHVDEDPYIVLHYSPYWRELKPIKEQL